MKGTAALIGMLLAITAIPAADAAKRFVYLGADEKLTYDTDSRGNRIPDFSFTGYANGTSPIPDVPVRVVVPSEVGNNGPQIQAAIDAISTRKPDAQGFRGVVLLLAGRHEVAGQLKITASGVVLRGQGETKTTLVATGTDRRTLVQIRGQADRTRRSSHDIASAYTPVGSLQLKLKSTTGLDVGDTILIEHPSTKEWIAALGMDRFPSRDKGSWQDWQPGKLDLKWDRTITKIDGDTITLDAPITAALDAKLSTAKVTAYTWPGRIQNCGVENLRIESTFDATNPRDEQHAWGGISCENASDCWVRQVTFANLAGSAVSVWESAQKVTVEDCTSTHPVSELGGYRRHTFYTVGQRTLFRRCNAEHGRHDFAVGYLATGPTVFTECDAKNATHDSGAIESWATGILFDNVTMDGGGLSLTNREIEGHGVGWAAANSVIYQCAAPVITCRTPPAAQNWAIGCWGQYIGDGHWRQYNEFVKPESLYRTQLSERIGVKAKEIGAKRAIPTDPHDVPKVDVVVVVPQPNSPKKLQLKNGWLIANGVPLTGTRIGADWWRGHVLPSRAAAMAPGITRFVPGRTGTGFTDDLDEVTDGMKARGQLVFDHHWGLWYDRRRDDHQMIRRMDGEVWPPFYEQPWARSGQGTAWDGLSQYDLTKFNPWYFGRLTEFADLAQRKGLVLVQQMYFQHNILEAGAHWADFPWRSANNRQGTGFPEPPPYENKKRILMAEAFYDITHPVRRELHRAYIRHCLDVLGTKPNVIFQTGEEFTGPLTFVQFWLDTITEWEKEHSRKVLIGLSCPKDVQDAILADPVRGPHIRVIDMKYWWYTANGGVYNPPSNQNLAPRQQYREWQGGKTRSEASVARQVSEYRTKYPDKAIVCSLDGANGWAVLAAGGSFPNLPRSTNPELLAAIPTMQPVTLKDLPDGAVAIGNPGQSYLVFAPHAETLRLTIGEPGQGFTAYWINMKTGELGVARTTLVGGRITELSPPRTGPTVLWVTRNNP